MISHTSANTEINPFSFITHIGTTTNHTPTIFFAISNFVGCLVVALLALWRGESGWTTVDKLSISGALISIIFWVLSGSAFLALIVNLCADFCGAIPTIEHASTKPGGESKLAWGTFAFGTILALGGISAFTPEECVLPFYFVSMDCFIASLVLFPHSTLTRWTSDRFKQLV